jgi:hypothetical protein
MSDLTFQCPECEAKLTVDARGAGLTVPCPACGKAIVVPASLPEAPAPAPAPPASTPLHNLSRHVASQKTQYKVVALGDPQHFPGRRDAGAIEHKLNELAQSGWKFLSMTRVRWPDSPGVAPEEVLLFFEKPPDTT